MKRKVFETPYIKPESFITEDVLCTSGTDAPHFVKSGKFNAGRTTYDSNTLQTLNS